MNLPAKKTSVIFRAVVNVSSQRIFEVGYVELLKKLKVIDKKYPDIDQTDPTNPDPDAADPEKEIRKAFRRFLESQNFYLALKNFDQLLLEKSGEKFYRNDNTVGWYHELVPVLLLLDAVHKGGDKGGVDLRLVNKHGGLEYAICAHLRHDSVEDDKVTYPDTNTLLENRKKFLEGQKKLTRDIKRKIPSYDMRAARKQVEMITTNVFLMSQRRHLIDGKWVKEDTRSYSSRQVRDPDATPLGFMSKQNDNTVNLATMLGAPKFQDPRKRLERCDVREDMYGSRIDLPTRAKVRWPQFSQAIDLMDSMMGFVLYPHFRYLESVDLHYKTPSNDLDLTGIKKYERALSVDLPRQFNPIHINFERMMRSVDPVTDLQKYDRLTAFVDGVVKPALVQIKHYKTHFPYFFNGNGDSPAPQTLRPQISGGERGAPSAQIS